MNQSFSAMPGPLARSCIVLWLKFPFGLPFMWVNSVRSDMTVQMYRQSWMLAVCICYKCFFPWYSLLYMQYILTHCRLNELSPTTYWKILISILGISGYAMQIFLEENGWTIHEQWRPWSDAAFCSIWSGSKLFANYPFKGQTAM